MRVRFIVFLMLVQVSPIISQEARYIVNNYEFFDDINLYSSVWSMAEDSLGVLYFGMGSSLLTYNGAEWQEYHNNGRDIRNIYIDPDGKIWYGSVDDFGMIIRDRNEGYLFQSYAYLLPDSIEMKGDIWSICSGKEGVFFQSNKYVYLYNKEKKLQVFRVGDSYHRAFCLEGRYVLNEAGSGLKYYKAGTGFSEMRGGKFFSDKILSGAVNISNDTILFASREKGAYKYSVQTGISVPAFSDNRTNTFLRDNKVYHLILLPDRTLAFATLYGGTLICDFNGKMLKVLNYDSGLLDNTHYFLGLSHDDILWICTGSSGISTFDINSPFSCWGYSEGVEGLVTSIEGYKEGVLAGALAGLFYLPKPGSDDYKVEKLLNSTVWDICSFRSPAGEEIKLISSPEGLYRLDDRRIKKIFGNDLIQESIRLNIDTSYILSVGRSNIYISEISDGEIKYLGKFPDLLDEFNSIAQEGNDYIWISTWSDKLIMIDQRKILLAIKKGDFREQITTDVFDTDQTSIVFNLKGKVVFSDVSGILYYDSISNSFKEYNALGLDFGNYSNIATASTDRQGNIWVGGNKIFVDLRDGTYALHELPFPNIRDIYSAYVFYHDNSGNTWIGGNKGLYMFENKIIKIPEKIKNIFVCRVEKDDFEYYSGKDNCVSDEDSTLIFQDGKGITFYYAFPNYKAQEHTMYSYYLAGFSDRWSDWSADHHVSFSNLDPGNYTFRVKAKMRDNAVDSPACIKFFISKPWYSTYVALAIYISIGGIILYYIVILVIKQRVRHKLRLESLIQNRLRQQLLFDIHNKAAYAATVESRNEGEHENINAGRETDEEAQFIDRLIGTIEKHIDESDLTVEKIGNILDMNQTALYRKTKSYSGHSVKELVIKIRMKKAAELLLSTGYSVSEVAYNVGFNDPGYFTRCFHREYGQSPKIFRKKGNQE